MSTSNLELDDSSTSATLSPPKAKRFKSMDLQKDVSSEDNAVIAGVGGNSSADSTKIMQEQADDSVVDMEGEPEVLSENNQSLPKVQPQVLPLVKYEYLDHTADVQIHAWGDNLEEAFEQCAMGMFGYITEIERVDNFGSERIEANGHDMLSLLFGFLDEWLFVFNADPYFVARKISITSFDRENFKISAIGYGETFDLSKHTQGTEVKAITYSNMQFHESDGYAEVFVIIDI